MKFHELGTRPAPTVPGGLTRAGRTREMISMFTTVTEDEWNTNRAPSTLPPDSAFESITSRDSASKKLANAIWARLDIDALRSTPLHRFSSTTQPSSNELCSLPSRSSFPSKPTPQTSPAERTSRSKCSSPSAPSRPTTPRPKNVSPQPKSSVSAKAPRPLRLHLEHRNHRPPRPTAQRRSRSKVTITFKPLWKLLIDREMTKEDLRIATGLSAATIAKMGKDGNVTTEVLARICEAMAVNINDICEVAKEPTK